MPAVVFLAQVARFKFVYCTATDDVNCVSAPTGVTPSAMRPGNPTPAHATGQGSPAGVRPNNPTPAHATKLVPERPGAPTPKQGKESESPNSHTFPKIHERPAEESKNHQYFVYGGRILTEYSQIICMPGQWCLWVTQIYEYLTNMFSRLAQSREPGHASWQSDLAHARRHLEEQCGGRAPVRGHSRASLHEDRTPSGGAQLQGNSCTVSSLFHNISCIL